MPESAPTENLSVIGGVQPARPLGIGIDFGTSNSVAAIYDGRNVTMVPLERSGPIMPSASFIDRQFVTSTGQDAIELYIESNTGRRVEFSAEYLGDASTGSIDELSQHQQETETEKVFGQSFNDAGAKGRLFRGTKRLLGDKASERLMVFDRPFRLVALITPILVRIRQSIQASLRKITGKALPGNHASLGRPVNFEGREADHNDIAVQRLGESYRHAGVSDQSYYPEPVAAALSYLTANPEAPCRTVLTVDFGGGTLDFCLLRKSADGFEVLATHGIGLGGDHLDQAVFRALIFPLLGKGENWRRRGDGVDIETPFPFFEYEDLLTNWAVSYLLNQNRYTTPVMDRMEQGDEGATKFKRLYEVITQNHSYLIIQEIKNLKARLSRENSAILDIPEIDVELEITRDQFESIIAPKLQQFEQSIQAALDVAGINAGEVDLVLRTGGSCLIPAVIDILERRFPGKVVEHDPFTGVAVGLAIADYFGLGQPA